LLQPASDGSGARKSLQTERTLSSSASLAITTTAVIARLDRAIQYSEKVVIESMGRGVLDARLRGHDSERTAGVGFLGCSRGDEQCCAHSTSAACSETCSPYAAPARREKARFKRLHQM